jgi:nucleotide-binding universal stress UspA family protein
MVTLKKVLVATDFEDASAAALDYGRALASAFGATLHVLHVTDDLTVIRAAGPEGYIGVSPDVQEDIERGAREQTRRLLTEDDRRALHAEAVTITSDRIGNTIRDYARANDCDLIVMGTHGRKALRRVLMGSIAESVARAASCPVLIVHTPQALLRANTAVATTCAVFPREARS